MLCGEQIGGGDEDGLKEASRKAIAGEKCPKEMIIIDKMNWE